MNAKEAREKTAENRIKLVEDEYLNVKTQIKYSVNTGNFYVIIERKLYTEVEARLRTEGFTIRDIHQNDESCTKILWE